MFAKPLVFIDVETTGANFYHDRIIEIGALRVENKKVVAQFSSLINPQTSLPPEIQQLTGITPQDLDFAPTFNQIKHRLYELLDGAVFTAHNSNFDYGFIRTEFKRHHLTYSNRHLCTVKLSRLLFPHHRHHNLDAVIARCQLTCNARHRALGDAEAIWHFYQFALAHFGEAKIVSHIKNLIKTPSLPKTIPLSTLRRLPESPGVYLFWGDTAIPLYIGKSINLKDRIYSHFAASSHQQKEWRLAQTIRNIETIPTAGDLHAQLLESSLIKSYQPLYNRQLRYTQSLTTLTQSTNPHGYFIATFTPGVKAVRTPGVDCLAIFRSSNQAKQTLFKIQAEYKLCPKLLGLESDPGPCFNYHLGTCLGACANKENPLKYNLRFVAAFTHLKLKRWPFPGPITVTETFDDLHALHTFNDWQHLKTKLNYTHSLLTAYSPPPTDFNYDVYKILSRYLLTPRYQKNISLLA